MPSQLGDFSFPVVDTLPVTGRVAQVVVWSTDGKAYQWNASTSSWDQLGTGAGGGGGGIETTPIGTIVAYGKASAPSGWLNCDGSAVSRTTYSALFSAIGTTYGTGDGSTTFNLPDLQGRVVVGLGTATGAVGATNHTLGQKAGEETHTLTITEMPSHAHNITGDTAEFTSNAYYVPRLIQPFNGAIYTTSAGGAAAVGGGAPHINMQPYTVASYIIKATSQPAGQQLQLSQSAVPMVILNKSAGQNISGTVWTALSFSTAGEESVDTDGMHDPAVNPTRITIKTPGVYLLSGWIGDGSTVVGQRSGSRWASILLNGAADVVYQNHNSPAADGATGTTITGVLKLNAGDYIELRAYYGIAGQTFPTIGRFAATWLSSGLGVVGDSATSFCRLKRSAALSLTTATWTAVPFDQEVNDTDNMHDLVTNTSRVTIRTPGVYNILGRAIPALNATGLRGLALYVNGAVIAENEEQPTASAGHGMDVAHTVALNAGDYVELFAYQSSGAALNLTLPELSVAIAGAPARAVVPTAQAVRTTTLSIPTGTFTAVPMTAVEADSDNIWASGTPTRLTVRTSGTYMVRGNLWFNTAIGTGNIAAMIQKNGAAYPARDDGGGAAGGGSRCTVVSAILDLVAGDYLELVAYQNSAGAVNLDSQGQAGGYSARFEMVKVASTGPTPETAPSSTPLDTLHLVGATGEPAMQNGAVHLDTNTGVPGAGRNVGFRKDVNGKVRLQGVMKSASNGTTVFTLPPGYRPVLSDVSQPIYASGGMAAVSVFSDGRVVLSNIVGLVTTWAYLDGVEFDTQTVTQLLTGPPGPSAPAPIIFRAVRVASLSAAVGHFGPIAFDSEPVDSAGAFNGTKFQPQKAGWYRVTAGVSMGTMNANNIANLFIAKNAVGTNTNPWANVVASSGDANGGASAVFLTASSLVYFNGTTDYVESRVYMSGATTPTINGSSGAMGESTFFEAEEVAPSVRDAASVDPWHSIGAPGEPAFANSWQNYGAPFNTAGFWKDSNGVVHLRGLINLGTLAAAVFTFPVGYRPPGQEILMAVSNAGGARIDITTAGVLIVNNYFAGGTNAFVSLDGLTFKAA